MRKRVRLLETTLRDGSFSVGFQFTAADAALIVRMLDAAGVGLIELGNGTGSFCHLNEPKYRPNIKQAATDEEYFEAARDAAGSAKLGVIAGAYAIDSLEMLAKYRFDFVRAAVMADQALESKFLATIEKAKSLGLICSVNLMQSIALTPGQLGEAAAQYEKCGADWVYVVDSAGGMLPETVKEYVRAVKDSCGLEIGLHAHHNSGLAVSNCMAAIEAGATLVDSTIQGIGREVGNPPTEQMVLLLQRLGHERGIQIEPICHLGDLLRPLLAEKGNDPTTFASGAAEVHSVNLPRLATVASERGLSLRAMLAGLARGNEKIVGYQITKFPEAIITAACAAQPSEEHSVAANEAIISVLAKEVESNSSCDLNVLAASLYSRARKVHRTSVMHLVPASSFPWSHPMPWTSGAFYGVTVPTDSSDVHHDIFGDRQPSVVVADPHIRYQASDGQTGLVLPFYELWLDATVLTADAVSCFGRIWIAAPKGQALDIQRRFDSRSGADIEVVDVAELGWHSRVKKEDSIVLLDAATDEIRDLPARVLRPAIGYAVGARVQAARAIAEELSAYDRDSEFVGPLIVPNRRQIAVDSVGAPRAVVDSPAGEAVANRVARKAAASLFAGKGPF